MNSEKPDARSRLFSLEQIGIKLGLEQIRALVAALDRPDAAFSSIVIAGTNGKGSVTAMVERGFRQAGYRTGRYTSPHLVDLEERFAIDGRPISPAGLDSAIERVLAAAETLALPPTFFETTTAVALELFRRAAVDVGVLEVGLGGRLDATNVVSPVGVAITSIDFDHEQYLGETIEDIAREKAGVIKPGAAVVLGANPRAVEAVVQATCDMVGVPLIRANEGVEIDVTMIHGRAALALTTPSRRYDSMSLSLRGRHQVDNALTAIRLLESLSERGGFAVPPAAIRSAVEDVEWPARLELIESGGGEILIDGAHNPAGARALSTFLTDTYGRKLPMVVGVMRDKKIERLLVELAASAAEFVFTAPANPRAMSPEELVGIAAMVAPGVKATSISRPLDAVRYAARAGRPVVVAGSLYLAGEVRAGLT